MSTLLQEFTKLVSTLNQREIDYAVCGGWAMAIHGLPRATLDIDLLVLSENFDGVWQTAKDLGYWVEGLPLSFHERAIKIRRISKIDEETKVHFTIDFLLVTEALKEVWRSRKNVRWKDGDFWVVSREGLIFLKEISGREQDLLDVKKLKEVEDES